MQLLINRWTDAYLQTVGCLLASAGSERSVEDAALLLAAVDGLLLEQLASGATAELEPQLRHLAVALIEAS